MPLELSDIQAMQWKMDDSVPSLSQSMSMPDLASLNQPNNASNAQSTSQSSHNFSLKSFLSSELLYTDSSGSLDQSLNQSISNQLMFNFTILPYFFERFLMLGVAICFDCFLYLLVVLPVRMVYRLVDRLIVRRLIDIFDNRKTNKRSTNPSNNQSINQSINRAHQRQITDFLRFCLLLVCWYFLSLIPMSRIYHYIRGQSILKLYVVYNMLCISDRLFASIGEDILDAVFASINQSIRMLLPYHPVTGAYQQQSINQTITQVFSIIVHFAVGTIYVFVHSLLLFCTVITLNVSINSNNSSLFVVLISANFVELKGAVFKRFDAGNLFQMSCSDVVERFQLMLYMAVILVMNVSSLPFAQAIAWMQTYALALASVLGSECAIDWIKHGFICKFNMISPRVYRAFTNVIANDFIATHLQQYQITSSNQSNNQSNNQTSKSSAPHSVARRLGLSTFPLAVLVMRVVIHALSNNQSNTHFFSHWTTWSIDSLIDWSIDCFFACLSVEFALKVSVLVLCVVAGLSMKLILTVAILGHTIQKVQEMESDQAINSTNSQANTQSNNQTTKQSNDQPQSSEQLKVNSHVSPINQPINQSSNQSNNQTVDLTSSPTLSPLRSINQSINQSPYLSSPASMHGNRLKKFADLSISLTNVQNPYTPLKQSINLPSNQSQLTRNQSTSRPLRIPEAVLEHQSFSLLEALEKEHALNQSNNQSINQSINQPINQPPTPSTPQVHAGDVIAAHERVGSVDLLVPTAALNDKLTAIDRYQITHTQSSIPT